MVENVAPPMPMPAEPSGPPAGRWRELALYLLGGFGLFLLVSLALGFVFRDVNIYASLAIYLANFITFAGSACYFGVLRPGRTWADFGLRRFDPRWLLAALLLAAAVLPLRAGAALLAEAVTGGSLTDMQARLDIIAPSGPLALNFIVTLLGVGVLAPIAEEFYFRGLIHRWFRSRFSFWPAVLLSSGIFALGHFDSIAVVASTFILGIVLALTLERGRSLWLPILIHMINNSLAVVLLYAVLLIQPRLGG
ncbi:MAG: CPBP family intramembrane glutamic endopeptidase [Anaerolineales bacterium]